MPTLAGRLMAALRLITGDKTVSETQYNFVVSSINRVINEYEKTVDDIIQKKQASIINKDMTKILPTNTIVNFRDDNISSGVDMNGNPRIDDMDLRSIHDLEFMNKPNHPYKYIFDERLKYLSEELEKDPVRRQQQIDELNVVLERAASLVQKVKSIYGENYNTEAVVRTGGIDSSNLKSYVTSPGSGGKRRKSRKSKKTKRSKSRKYRRPRSMRQMR